MKLFLLLAVMLCGCCGCDSRDATAFSFNLDNLNWQTGALIALAYVANSRGHFSSAAVALRGILQTMKILPSASSSSAVDAEEAAKLLAELYLKLTGHPELQQGLLDLMQPPRLVARPTKD